MPALNRKLNFQTEELKPLVPPIQPLTVDRTRFYARLASDFSPDRNSGLASERENVGGRTADRDGRHAGDGKEHAGDRDGTIEWESDATECVPLMAKEGSAADLSAG